MKQTYSLLTIVVMTICVLGCGAPSSNTENLEPEIPERQLAPLKLLVVGNTKIGDAMERQWSAQRNGQLTVESKTIQEFETEKFTLDDSVDVVIYPPFLLGELVANSSIAELPKEIWSDSEYFNSQEILRHHRTVFVRYAKEVRAIPLGSALPVMLYRQDVLDALDVAPPATWDEFKFLSQTLNSAEDLKSESGDALPTEVGMPTQEFTLAELFLSRVASAVRSRGKLSILFDRNDMTPLLDSPPFLEALEDLQQNHASIVTSAMTPKQLYQKMVNGKLAVAITWPSAQFTLSEDGKSFDESKVLESIRIARLPGSLKTYNASDGGWLNRDKSDSIHVDVLCNLGWIASVNQRSGSSLSAFEFLKWAPSKLISLKTMTESPLSGPFRASHLGAPFRWTGEAISPDAAQDYADVIATVNDELVVMVALRIPGSSRYMRALDESLRACLEDKLSPKDALRQATDAWEKITDEMGRRAQLAQLRKSQGI